MRVPSLIDKEIKKPVTVKNLQEKMITHKDLRTPICYDYTPEERALIGKYAAENRIGNAVMHSS